MSTFQDQALQWGHWVHKRFRRVSFPGSGDPGIPQGRRAGRPLKQQCSWRWEILTYFTKARQSQEEWGHKGHCCWPQALGAAADHSTEFRESIARPASHLHDNPSEVPLGWAMSAHQRFSKWASRHGYKVIFPGILSSPSPRRKHRSLKFCSFFHNHGNMLKPSI